MNLHLRGIIIDNVQSNPHIQPTSSVNSAKAASVAANAAEKPNPRLENVDEYVPSEEKEPIGLYEVSSDDQGDKSVKFYAPKTEQTTANTDSVDREIKSLKEKQTALQRQLKTAAPEEAEALQKQLEQISAELVLKDNDNYRKANTIFS